MQLSVINQNETSGPQQIINVLLQALASQSNAVQTIIVDGVTTYTLLFFVYAFDTLVLAQNLGPDLCKKVIYCISSFNVVFNTVNPHLSVGIP